MPRSGRGNRDVNTRPEDTPQEIPDLEPPLPCGEAIPNGEDEPSPGGNGAAPSPSPAARKSDVFDDLDSIRIDPKREQLATRVTILRIAVRRPKPQEFIRAHPSFEITLHGLEDRENGDHYIVKPEPGLLELLRAFIHMTLIVPSINRQGTVFLWPLKIGGDRTNPWNDTARLALDAARHHWVSVRSNRDSGSYDIVDPIDPLPDPIWPDRDFPALMRLGYGNHKFIDTADHPIVLNLTGRIL